MPGCVEPVLAVLMTAQWACPLHRGRRCAHTSVLNTCASQRLPLMLAGPSIGVCPAATAPARPQKGLDYDNACDNGSAGNLAPNSRAAETLSLSRFHAVGG